MAYHFSANQYENAYTPTRLNNWEIPKFHPDRPRMRKGTTKIIADDFGHLLPGVKRTKFSPWGGFLGTNQLPRRLTRRFVEEYHECLVRTAKYKSFAPTARQIWESKPDKPPGSCPPKVEPRDPTRIPFKPKKPKKPVINVRVIKSKKSHDFEYIPGDFTPAQQQHASRQLLLQQKYERDNDIDAELPLNKLYLRDHNCGSAADYAGTSNVCVPAVPLAARFQSRIPDPFRESETGRLPEGPEIEIETKMPLLAQHSITEKPHERFPSPIIPAYANFELAKRMHNENLDHQPLPDCVADRAFRKMQLTGAHPGLALEVDHIATGVGVKTHNAGPTHCTKMKIYRPKTCGVVPKGSNADAYRFGSSAEPGKKLGAMDLAIRWDYRPSNPADEPERPKHIDGSNDSTGPAVFTYVKSPRENSANLGTGRSAGVFTNTLGETGFFDKDIMRRKTDFGGQNIERDADCGCGDDAYASDPPPRARSVTRDFNPAVAMPSRFGAQYQSSPNIVSTQQYKKLRDKYLGTDALPCDAEPATGCKRANPGFFRRARTRLCHKVAPEPALCCRAPSYERHMPCRPAAFRAGLPKYNAAGHFVSSDSGCSMGSNHGNRVLVVPRPRIPYAKRNYDIDTLVPPFTSFGGGAGEGGYPEHWRLASVYQHAYKPIEQRRTPLLHTVYK